MLPNTAIIQFGQKSFCQGQKQAAETYSKMKNEAGTEHPTELFQLSGSDQYMVVNNKGTTDSTDLTAHTNQKMPNEFLTGFSTPPPLDKDTVMLTQCDAKGNPLDWDSSRNVRYITNKEKISNFRLENQEVEGFPADPVDLGLFHFSQARTFENVCVDFKVDAWTNSETLRGLNMTLSPDGTIRFEKGSNYDPRSYSHNAGTLNWEEIKLSEIRRFNDSVGSYPQIHLAGDPSETKMSGSISLRLNNPVERAQLIAFIENYRASRQGTPGQSTLLDTLF